VRLDDTDTQPIVRRLIPSLTPSGTPPKKWQFKSKADGLQKILLKPDSAVPGQFKLTLKAKRWFAFTNGADQTNPADADLTVTIGGECFAHPATQKIDCGVEPPPPVAGFDCGRPAPPLVGCKSRGAGS